MSYPGTYRHTQRAPLCLVVYLTAALMLGMAWFLRNEPPQPFTSLILVSMGLLTLVLAAAFHHLTVEDEDDRIAIRFGPLPLFRRTIRYEDISEVEIGRTTIMDGWGIHMSLRGGWVWNLWGRDCVVIRHKGTLRVGTDDAQNLAEFLKGKL